MKRPKRRLARIIGGPIDGFECRLCDADADELGRVMVCDGRSDRDYSPYQLVMLDQREYLVDATINLGELLIARGSRSDGIDGGSF